MGCGVRYRESVPGWVRRLAPVLSVIDLRGTAGERVDYAAAVPRAEFDVAAAVERVLPICEAVKDRGEAALAEFSERFDHVVPEHFRVPESALDEAVARLDPDLRKAFEISIARRRTVSAAELGEAEVRVDVAPGAVVTQRMIAVDRVGLYVPGGLAPLASSVIMNVVPAQVAGVRSIALASPPQREFGGLPHPSILAVCRLLGVEEVYAVGGRAGDRHVRVRGRGPVPPGRPGHRAGQHLCGRRQAGAQGAGEHRLRGRADRDRDPGRRDRRSCARGR